MRRLVLSTLVLLSLLVAPVMAQPPEDGNQIKAVFLYNFANFVRWPDEAFSASGNVLKMCIFGDALLGSFLDEVDGSRVRDKRLNVIKTSEPKVIDSGCHILFVSQEKKDYLPLFLKSKQHIYVLSVSDVEGFARNGGVVSIVRNSDKLTFEINLDVALKNGLLISSDLLSLARIVGRDGKNVDASQLGPNDTLMRDAGKSR
jgi:hypothetical protein